jgi:hypothetical protein
MPATVPIELAQELDCRQERVTGSGRPESEGLEQRGRIAADPGIALSGAEQRIGRGGRGQRLDIRLGLNQAGPADLAIWKTAWKSDPAFGVISAE